MKWWPLECCGYWWAERAELWVTVCPMCQCVSSVSVSPQLWPGTQGGRSERWAGYCYWSPSSPAPLSLSPRLTAPYRVEPPSPCALRASHRERPDGECVRMWGSARLSARSKSAPLNTCTGRFETSHVTGTCLIPPTHSGDIVMCDLSQLSGQLHGLQETEVQQQVEVLLPGDLQGQEVAQ